MRKSKRSLIITLASALFASVVVSGATPVNAMEDYSWENTQGDIVTQYGWSVIANELNEDTWEFGSDGNPSYSWAAEGDIANQRVYNYALRNLEVAANDSYSVSCTFTPDSDTDLTAERSYGIVCYYQDSDNYLIYWLQQKPKPEWSGQFYGRIDGSFRRIFINPEYRVGSLSGIIDIWNKGEYYDLWWDNAAVTHPAILNNNAALTNAEVTLKVSSEIGEVEVNSEKVTARKFTLQQIINGETFTSLECYINGMDLTDEGFYTGIYTEAFNVGLSDFTLTTTTSDFVGNVEEKIDALSEAVENLDNISYVDEARRAYEGLLEHKDSIDSQKVSKLEAIEKAHAEYVDEVILAVDDTKSTFLDDVMNAYELYASLPIDFVQSKITQLSKLTSDMQKMGTWSDPNAQPSEPSEETSSEEVSEESQTQNSETTDEPNKDNNGCGGSVVAVSGLVLATGLVGVLVAAKKRKED